MASAYPWAVKHGGMILPNTVSENQVTAKLNYLCLYRGYDGAALLASSYSTVHSAFRRLAASEIDADISLIRVQITEADYRG